MVTEVTKKTELPEEITDKLPPELNAELKPWHCGNCGRFLAFIAIIEGTVAVKCRRCKEFNVLDNRQAIDK